MRDEIDEELRGHLEMRAEELHADGLPIEQARHEALLQFGDLEATRRYCRRQDELKENSMRRTLVLEDLLQDARVCLRNLFRAPILSLTVVATVGLGIGATTVIFSAVNAALLRPLPYADPDQLVRIYTDAPPNRFRFSAVDWIALDAQQTHFTRIAAFTDRPMAFSDGAVAERLRGRVVSWTYFSLLGIRPELGRDFAEPDGRLGAPPAVIVSHGFWQQRLGGRPDVIGTPVRLDGVEHTLAGVLPRPWARSSSARTSSFRRNGTPPGARAPSFSASSDGCVRVSIGRPRRVNCAPSIGTSSRCGRAPIRTSGQRGACWT